MMTTGHRANVRPIMTYPKSPNVVSGLLLVLLLSLPVDGSAERVRYMNATVFGAKVTRPPTNSPTSLVTDGGRIVSDRGPVDRVVDLRGGFVVPGLVDAHAHLLSLGRSLETIDLRGARSWEEAVGRVKRSAPETGWIFGRGWDQTRWKGGQFPTHESLSRAFPSRPVMLKRVDGHAIMVNAEAMRRAGVTRSTATPKGGRILRRPDGSPSGVFIDAAMPLIRGALPALTTAERRRLLSRALSRCASLGLTGIHDMGMDLPTAAILQRMDSKGELPLRVFAYLSTAPARGDAPPTDAEGDRPRKGRRFSIVGVKLFADGALGSRGAALLSDYSDEPGHRGLLQLSSAELKSAALRAAGRGLQVAIHAIGDRGVRVAIDALSAVAGTRPRLPPRLEHAQVVHPEDFDRLVEIGAVASMQPTHATSDMRWAEKRVGRARIEGAYAWRTMLAKGIPLVFGSDFPVESPDIRKGIYAAITRMDAAGHPAGGWYPAQRMTAVETLTAFSTSAGAAVGADPTRADFTVFDRDLTRVSPTEILRATTRLVVVGGEVVYRGPAPR